MPHLLISSAHKNEISMKSLYRFSKKSLICHWREAFIPVNFYLEIEEAELHLILKKSATCADSLYQISFFSSDYQGENMTKIDLLYGTQIGYAQNKSIPLIFKHQIYTSTR